MAATKLPCTTDGGTADCRRGYGFDRADPPIGTAITQQKEHGPSHRTLQARSGHAPAARTEEIPHGHEQNIRRDR
jgi:hypothetical protein